MEKELAQMIVNSATRAAVEIGNLMPLLNGRGEGPKDENVRHAITSAVYEVGLIRERVFEQFPDLEGEIEARLNAYGRTYY